MMRLITILSAAISLWSAIASARAANIIVDGADTRSTAAIRDIISENLRDPFDMDQLQSILGLIYSLGKFNDVEVYFDEKGEKTDVIFKVYPLRMIRKIQILGNRSFSTFDIANELGMTEGEGYSPDKVKTAAENVKKFYNLRGYLNATVNGEFAKIEGTPDLVFSIVINESDPCLIDEITFKSVNQPLDRQLQSHFNGYKDKIFSQDQLTTLSNDINEQLFKNKYFSAQIAAPEMNYNGTRTRVSLSFVVNDPYVFAILYEIQHEGPGMGLDESQIEGRLDLNPTNRLSNSPLEDLLERITRIYKKAGYANVSAKYKENLIAQDFERRVTFSIVEGPKVKIDDVVFEGTFSRPSKYYKNFLLSHSGDLVGSHYYNSDDIDTGIKNLLIELQNEGFISAKITGSRTDFDKTSGKAVVRITLDEGPETFIDKIAFQGVHSLSRLELENTIGRKAGGPLNLSTLEGASANIVDLYQSKGYLDAQVTNQGKSIISYSADNTKATLTFNVTEGPQITVSSIVIEGNTFTKEYVIRRELQFRPGEVLTPDKIAFTEQKLQKLSLFSSVDIHTLEEDLTQGNRTVLVRVQERNPGIFKSGVGVNNDLGVTPHVFTGAAYNNLWGTGRSVSARAEMAVKTDPQYNDFVENSVNMGYGEPFVLNTENTGKLNLSESQKIYSVEGSLVYAAQVQQVDVVLERDITQHLKMVYEVYGIANEKTWETSSTPGTTAPNQIILPTTGPSFIYDRRDDPFNPTRGDLTTLSLEYSNPLMAAFTNLQAITYLKVDAGYTRYTPIGRCVWANEIKGGYIGTLSSDPNAIIPAIKGFLLGGPSTIRGFGTQEAFPALTEYPNQPSPQQSQILPSPPAAPNTPNPNYGPYFGFAGSSYYVLAKTEFRFPIYGIMGGAVFYDGGEVEINSSFGTPAAYHYPSNWKDSAGFGFLFTTPVGPASVEYAWKLHPDDARAFVGPEAPGALIVNIGVF